MTIQCRHAYTLLNWSTTIRASLRHVRGVWPNRAAHFMGPPSWTPKIPYKCWPKNQKCCNQMHFPSIQCSKMRLRQGFHPGHRWGSLQCSPRPLAGFKGQLCGAEWEGRRRDREGGEGEVDSDGEGKGGEKRTADWLRPPLTTTYFRRLSLLPITLLAQQKSKQHGNYDNIMMVFNSTDTW